MNNKSFALALIVLIGIGVFALPSTMALFAGQHSFYNIDATGNQIPCTKCHGDVKAELSSGYSTTTGTKSPHGDFRCEYCHRAEPGMASGDDAYAKITYSDGVNRIYLVTNVYNFENGKFPKVINYVTGMTVDNWNTSVYKMDGVTPFINEVPYAGSLSTGISGVRYNYSYASEVSTTLNGVPLDTNPATAGTAFNPRAVTFSGSAVSLLGAGSRLVTPGTQYHAASLVSCMECHGGEQSKGIAGDEISTMEPYNHARWLLDATDNTSNCSNCHYGSVPHTPSFMADLEAGGFGLTGESDTGAREAHKAWVTTGDSLSTYKYGANNDACVSCHTHVAVNITYNKKTTLVMEVTKNQDGNYTINSVVSGGTTKTYSGN